MKKLMILGLVAMFAISFAAVEAQPLQVNHHSKELHKKHPGKPGKKCKHKKHPKKGHRRPIPQSGGANN